MAFDASEEKKLNAVAPAILRWYDENARDLPWRTPPRSGAKDRRRREARPDPYRVWLSEIMLQQTTVATVAPRYQRFLDRWPTVEAMATAPVDDILGEWAGLGYYARARNLHKCAVAVAALGDFPDTEEALKALPGIGDYTAAAIAAIAFDRRAVVVDGNIERVVARLFLIEAPLPAAKPEIKEQANAIWPQERSGDFAQGLMDLGAMVCRPKSPTCLLCPVRETCAAHGAGRVETLPRKAPKKTKPNRRGIAFALTNARGEFLFERRPDKGLLGGMLGLPGSPWSERAPVKSDIAAHAPAEADWRMAGEARHVFTHFQLSLHVYTARAPKGFRRKDNQIWIKPDAAQLPTVMKKAVGAALTTP